VGAVSLVISDVDGTLVTPEKTLTDANIRAVHRLHARGIGFTVISSRPPFGLRMLVAPLAFALPLGAFNGGAMVKPTLEVIEQRLVPEPAARRSVEVLEQCGADVWVFTAERWLAQNPAGDYVPRERRTLLAEPTAVKDFLRISSAPRKSSDQAATSPALPHAKKRCARRWARKRRSSARSPIISM